LTGDWSEVTRIINEAARAANLSAYADSLASSYSAARVIDDSIKGKLDLGFSGLLGKNADNVLSDNKYITTSKTGEIKLRVDTSDADAVVEAY